MIEIVTGQIGGGKSYYSTYRIVQALKDERRVVTNTAINRKNIIDFLVKRKGGSLNFRLSYAKYLERFIVELDDEQMFTFWNYGWNNSFFVLDELHLWFDQNFFKVEAAQKLVRYLSQSRKGQDDLLLITQNVNQLYVGFRRLANYFWHIHNPKGHPAFRFLPIPLPQAFIIHQYYGENPKPVYSNLMFPDKKIFSFYETMKKYQQIDKEKDRALLTKLNVTKDKTVSSKSSKPSSSDNDYVMVEHYHESPLGY